MNDTELFEQAYRAGTGGWIIGEPQPVIVALAEAGMISGAVLDPGCGLGENAIMLAQRGFDVAGIDFSPLAINGARVNAARAGVDVTFAQADALSLDGRTTYDTVIDSALFHVFEAEDRKRYVDSLARATKSGGVVHLLALAETDQPSFPQVSQHTIRAAFDDERWELEALGDSTYRGILDGVRDDFPAWLARLRRA